MQVNRLLSAVAIKLFIANRFSFTLNCSVITSELPRVRTIAGAQLFNEEFPAYQGVAG